MSDIWSVDDSDGAVAGKNEASGDWEVSSGSSEEERPRKRAKKTPAKRRVRALVCVHQQCHALQPHIFRTLKRRPVLLLVFPHVAVMTASNAYCGQESVEC